MGCHTRDLIRQYVAQGGFVLLLDDAPSYLEGEPYDYSWLQSNCTMGDLENAQPYHIADTDNELYYTYRLYEGRPFLYVQNASRDTTYTQTFFLGDRIRSFTALDPVTLTTRSLPLTVTLPECGSLLLFPSEDPAAYTAPLPEYTLQFTKAAVSFEHNFLTLNQVRYSKDGRNYSEPLLRHKLFQQLLEERYEGSLWLKYDFTIETLPKRLTLLAEKGENLAFAVNGKPFAFSKSYEDEPALWLGDITSYIHEGLNSYEVELHWHQSDETYYALFGENVTESLKNCIVYDSEIEDVYLAGPFGVYSAEPFVNNDEETLLGRNFYIGAVPETITEPVTDGLPFFRGHLTLTQTVHLEDPHVMLRPLGRYQLAAVKVNGCNAGEAFLDRLVDISRYAKAGDNEIEVTFTIGNRNVMGPFHVASREASVGPDSFKCYDLDGWYKFYRFYKKQ